MMRILFLLSSGVILTNSIRLAVHPTLQMMARPNSVMIRRCVFSNKSGHDVRSTAAYSSNVGATSSESKLVGRPPPISRVRILLLLTCVSISLAKAIKHCTPAASMGNPQPWLPTVRKRGENGDGGVSSKGA